MVQVNIKKLDPRAVLPTYGTPGAAGADLYALLDAPLTIAPGETVFVHTGLSLELPEGYAGLVYPRSGLSCKRGTRTTAARSWSRSITTAQPRRPLTWVSVSPNWS